MTSRTGDGTDEDAEADADEDAEADADEDAEADADEDDREGIKLEYRVWPDG